jgi:hypothetical protein
MEMEFTKCPYIDFYWDKVCGSGKLGNTNTSIDFQRAKIWIIYQHKAY